MDLSIIVLTFNSKHCIEQCIHAAFAACADNQLRAEICLFDNGSTDGTVAILEQLKQQYSHLQVLSSDNNVGTTQSRNAAISLARGEFLLVLDSDAFVTAECLAGLYQHLQDNPQCGLVGPKLTYASGNFQMSYDRFPTLQRKFERYFFLRNIESSSAPIQSQTKVDYLISACWFMPKKVFDTVGPLDERIFYAPEDVDYCLRVWKAGFEIHYLPQVAMVHDAQELSRGIKLNKFTFLHLWGLLYYFSKHRYFFSLTGTYKKIAAAVANRWKDHNPRIC